MDKLNKNAKKYKATPFLQIPKVTSIYGTGELDMSKGKDKELGNERKLGARERERRKVNSSF